MLPDPDLGWYSGLQYPNNKDNFGLLLDSIPDSWGLTLMQKREPHRAREEVRTAKILHDIDYLLGVFDESRMGALRFKLDAVTMALPDHCHGHCLRVNIFSPLIHKLFKRVAFSFHVTLKKLDSPFWYLFIVSDMKFNHVGG